MLLRRITKHIKNENWFAVFIDFLIVVVGVFIGIQVANWNEAQGRQQTERSYIERLREDLASNNDDINQRIAYFTQVREYGLSALNALEQDTESLDEQFLIDIYQASHILPREFGRDTYDEILSVGANEAIADVEVRKRLANFYRSIKAQLNSLKIITPYRGMTRRSFPYKATKAIRKACGDIVKTGVTGQPIVALPESCQPRLSDVQIAETLTALLSLDLRVELGERLSDLDVQINMLRLIRDRANLLDDFLQEVQQ
jgi:hypothetical protein